jgi:catechol 2,3-dioxygenase-like lactoylglutathione lyase family enzyme
MMTDTATDSYSSFTVTDLESTRAFYQDVLGLTVEDRDGMLTIHLPGGGSTVAYASRNHQPARFTILNIVVPDLPTSVSELARRGLAFEHYEGTPVQTDPDGI